MQRTADICQTGNDDLANCGAENDKKNETTENLCAAHITSMGFRTVVRQEAISARPPRPARVAARSALKSMRFFADTPSEDRKLLSVKSVRADE